MLAYLRYRNRAASNLSYIANNLHKVIWDSVKIPRELGMKKSSMDSPPFYTCACKELTESHNLFRINLLKAGIKMLI